MQHIAATKSDLAAIGIDQAGTHAQSDYENAERFRDVFNGQRPPSDKQQKGYAEPVEPIQRQDKQPQVAERKSQTDTKRPSSDESHNNDKTQERSEEHDTSIDSESKTEEQDISATPTSDTTDTKPKGDSNSGPVEGQDDNADAVASEIEEEASELHLQADVEIDWLTLVEGSQKHLNTARDANADEVDAVTADTRADVGNDNPEGEEALTGEDPSQQNASQGAAVTEKAEQDPAESELEALLTRLERMLSQISSDTPGDAESAELEMLKHSISVLRDALDNPAVADADSPNNENTLGSDPIDIDLLASLLGNASSDADSLDSVSGENELVTAISEVAEQSDARNLDEQLEAILNLPDAEQKAILEHLAKTAGEKLSDAKDIAQDSDLPRADALTPDTPEVKVQATSVQSESQNTQRQDFLTALQSKVDEIKSQIKQGHAPAIDLKQVIAEAAEQAGLVSATSPAATEVLNEVTRTFSSTLDLAQQLSTQLTGAQQAGLGERLASRDTAPQLTLEAQRSAQHLAQTDKAVNITQPEGQSQLAEKVRYMVNQNNLQADIRLDPPELGSMKVRINMSGETAAVSFIVQSPQAKDMLDQAVPRLRELLQEGGIELGQSSVQQEQNDASQEQGDGSGQFASNDDSFDAEEDKITEQRIVNGRLGGIDYFV